MGAQKASSLTRLGRLRLGLLAGFVFVFGARVGKIGGSKEIDGEIPS